MRLMVSVISAREAREALSAGAVLLDVKNPEEGSLGAQFPDTIKEIRQTAPRNIEISAAIGDMPNLPGTAALAALGAAVCGADYIKVGLHGQRNEAEAIVLMRAVKKAAAQYHTSIIAAGYADCHRIGTLDPRCLPLVASEAGIQGFLVDTAIKDGSTLMDYLGFEDLRALAGKAHADGLLFGAAGSLSEKDLQQLKDCGVDVVGFRSAVCRDGRRGSSLDPALVRNLVEKFRS